MGIYIYIMSATLLRMCMRRDVRVPAVRSMRINSCMCVYYRNSDGERERWSERVCIMANRPFVRRVVRMTYRDGIIQTVTRSV